MKDLDIDTDKISGCLCESYDTSGINLDRYYAKRPNKVNYAYKDAYIKLNRNSPRLSALLAFNCNQRIGI